MDRGSVLIVSLRRRLSAVREGTKFRSDLAWVMYARDLR